MASLQDLQAQISRDPAIQAILRNPSLSPRQRQQLLATRTNINQLLGNDYFLTNDGQVKQMSPWYTKYEPLAIAGGVALTGGALGAFSAPAAAGGATAGGAALGDVAATSPAALPAGLGLPAADVISGTAAGAAPAVASGMGSTAAGAFPGSDLAEMQGSTVTGGGTQGAGFWGSLLKGVGGWKGLAGIGATVGSAIYNQHAINKATQQETDAANKALALQEKIFDTSQQNFAPYLQAGSHAIGNLDYLMGNGTGNFSAMNTAQPRGNIQLNPAQTGGWSSMNSGSPIGPAQGQLVNMRAPNGQMKAVPADQVQHYTQLGAQVVQ